MLLQSHLLSAVSGENNAVIQEFQCLMLILICCIKVELQCELHICETGEGDAVIQKIRWLMLHKCKTGVCTAQM